MPVQPAARADTTTIVVASHVSVPSDSGASVGSVYAATSRPSRGTSVSTSMSYHVHFVSPTRRARRTNLCHARGRSRTGRSRSMLVADFVLERLRQWGVHRIYGYPGDGIN